jgi:hypothetical protein
MRGKDYTKLRVWFSVLSSRVDTIVKLLENDLENPASLPMAMNVIKCGLFSHNIEVVEACFRFFTRLWALVNERESNYVKHSVVLKEKLYEWFIKSQLNGKYDEPIWKNSPVDIYQTWLKIPKKPSELEALTNEAGICAFIRAYHYHGDEFNDQFAQGLILLGETDYLGTVNTYMLQHCQNYKDFILIIHDLFDLFMSTQKGRLLLVESGSLVRIIDLCIKICKEMDDQTQVEK